MAYEFKHLSSNLILITWKRYPTKDEEEAFLKEHTQQLSDATEPLYYISDLRSGRITNLDTINRLSKLAKHENYGGSTAFSKDFMSKIVVKTFQMFTSEAETKSRMFETVEEAIAYLESLKAGLTQNIDWNEHILAT